MRGEEEGAEEGGRVRGGGEEKGSGERKGRKGEEEEERKKTGRKGREGGWGVNSQVFVHVTSVSTTHLSSAVVQTSTKM